MSEVSGMVIGNTVVALHEGIPAGSDREDVLSCLAHADDFASRYFDPKREYQNWLFRYHTRLQQRGWTLINPIQHTPQVIFDASELENVTYKIFDSVNSRRLAKLAQAAWSSLKTNRLARGFFSGGHRNGELGRMQLIPCALDANGDITLLTYCIRLTGTVDTRDFDLWTVTQREMLLRISGGVYRFDRVTYARYREDILQQLDAQGDRVMQKYPI